jgi:hypothetical protein
MATKTSCMGMAKETHTQIGTPSETGLVSQRYWKPPPSSALAAAAPPCVLTCAQGSNQNGKKDIVD